MSAWAYVRALAVAVATCVLFTGCGQSGPLILPGEAGATDVPSEEAPQDDEQEEDQQD